MNQPNSALYILRMPSAQIGKNSGQSGEEYCEVRSSQSKEPVEKKLTKAFNNGTNGINVNKNFPPSFVAAREWYSPPKRQRAARRCVAPRYILSRPSRQLLQRSLGDQARAGYAISKLWKQMSFSLNPQSSFEGAVSLGLTEDVSRSDVPSPQAPPRGRSCHLG